MKPKIKMEIDLLMTVLLLSLMAYQITGQELHEWFGSGMLVLFIVHNILNIRWYSSLFKGKYTSLRAALPINGPMATARTVHMAASYWGFVLMSIHAGFHWAVVTGMFRRLAKGKSMPGLLTWLLRLAVLVFAGHGAIKGTVFK